MAQIDKPSLHFNTKLYTGTGSTQSITGVGFQPDFTWIKNRSTTHDNILTDAVRGVTKEIRSNVTDAEATDSNGLTAFGTDGFTVGSKQNLNKSGSDIVSWNWKAGGGQGSSNTDGSINTTYTSANTTAGFSISTYTGTGSNATVGHGLGVAPKFIMVKKRSGAVSWAVQTSTGAGYEMNLNNNESQTSTSNYWNSTEPTSSVFSIGTNGIVNESGATYVAYCFAEKKGYSKFGSYEGNGNADGTFIYTGFKPAWVMVKRSDSSNNWVIYDNKRANSFNEITHVLLANESVAEATSTSDDDCDFLSNGVKMRCSNNGSNGSGASYIYMAFAENPIVGSNNIPATAR